MSQRIEEKIKLKIAEIQKLADKQKETFEAEEVIVYDDRNLSGTIAVAFILPDGYSPDRSQPKYCRGRWYEGWDFCKNIKKVEEKVGLQFANIVMIKNHLVLEFIVRNLPRSFSKVM